MKELIECCKSRNLTLGTCESCTGGLFASMLTSVSGASAVYRGSVVSYAADVKESVVGVEHELIQQFGVVSAEVAESMAKHAQQLLQCDIMISFTGNAGPGICDNKPVGCIYAGAMIQNQYFGFHFQLNGERNELRTEICVILAKKIVEILEKS